MKITKNQLIAVVIVLIVILGGYWFLSRSNQTTNTVQTAPSPVNSFFPTTAIKNIVTTISSVITSTSTNNPGGDPSFDQSPKKDFDILKAHKIADGPIDDFIFTNTTGSTTIAYINKKSGSINFLPAGASSTKLSILTSTSTNIYSPDGKQLLTIKNTSDGLMGEVTNLKTKLTTKVTLSPLTDWLVAWPELNNLSLQSKPSSGVSGFTFTFNLKNKSTSKVLGPLNGLNSLISPDASKIIYSTNENGQINTGLAIISKNTNVLGIKTLVDKCIWKDKKYVICAVTNKYQTANYPDAWYQGLTFFNDDIWLINTDNLESYLISIFGQPLASDPVDAINLKISPDGKTLYFINKRDSSLWSFDISHAF